jgi:hypothetical protein
MVTFKVGALADILGFPMLCRLGPAHHLQHSGLPNSFFSRPQHPRYCNLTSEKAHLNTLSFIKIDLSIEKKLHFFDTKVVSLYIIYLM